MVQQNRQLVVLAVAHRLLGSRGVTQFPAAGGLMRYGVNRFDLFRRVAVIVDKILEGASAAELPMEQPTEYELILNRKTAKSLGVELPPELVLLATRVID
jgi:putative ABC transport system substrate-binding protein